MAEESAPASPSSDPAKVTVMTAADFTGMDQDRPKADESQLPPQQSSVAAPAAGKKGGRPRSSNTKDAIRMREKYAAQKAATPPPPDFSDLPGGRPQATPGTPPAAPLAPVYDYAPAARVAFGLVTQVLAMTVSKEWLPTSDFEKETMEEAVRKYFEFKQWRDLPPGLSLAFLCAFYAIGRMNKPETSAKLKKVIDRFAKRKKPDEPAAGPGSSADDDQTVIPMGKV